MADPQIEKLLIVQHRDATLHKIEQDLARIPKEKASLEAGIEEEQARIEAAQKTMKSKEVQRKELDADVKARETAVQRFRTQQLEVKKNDEYRALTQQIEQAEAEISTLEEREIELMLEIDAAKEAFETQRDEIELRIQERRKQIEMLGERQKNLLASIDAAKAELSQSREGVAENYLEQYDRVKKLVKRGPYVVPIQDHKCGGCHLRVSNEVSRDALNAGEPHFCDQCARMVYA